MPGYCQLQCDMRSNSCGNSMHMYSYSCLHVWKIHRLCNSMCDWLCAVAINAKLICLLKNQCTYLIAQSKAHRHMHIRMCGVFCTNTCFDRMTISDIHAYIIRGLACVCTFARVFVASQSHCTCTAPNGHNASVNRTMDNANILGMGDTLRYCLRERTSQTQNDNKPDSLHSYLTQ